jgi:hypothetical protein
LLDLILQKAREITAADAGSPYLVEKGEIAAEGGLRVPQLFRVFLDVQVYRIAGKTS